MKYLKSVSEAISNRSSQPISSNPVFNQGEDSLNSNIERLSNLEKEFEEISDYFLEISEVHPNLRFTIDHTSIRTSDIDKKTAEFKSFIRKISGSSKIHFEVYFDFREARLAGNDVTYEESISLINDVKSPIKKMINWECGSIEHRWSKATSLQLVGLRLASLRSKSYW